ncbi:MAG: DUF2157 domain-containing protein [Saprospiraceae bacterium]|nr:DUF2157 domain-containing protein [Saprospiraceae bacterium]
MKSIRQSLDELLGAGVIDQPTAERIRTYYQSQQKVHPYSLLLFFGVIGSLLVGSGIILIIAHNWEFLNRFWQTTCALGPLILSQFLVGHAVSKHPVGSVWRESTATLLLFALGGCLAMISQIYQLPGTLDEFLVLWILLSLPLAYLVPSFMVTCLSLFGITWYGIITGYDSHGLSAYWWLLMLWLPAYVWGITRLGGSVWFQWLHGLVPLSVTIMLGNLTYPYSAGTWIIYLIWGGVLLHLSTVILPVPNAWFQPANRITGSAVLMILLYIFSFRPFWDQWTIWYGQYMPPLASYSLWIMIALGLFYLAWFFRRHPPSYSLVFITLKLIPFVLLLLLLVNLPGNGGVWAVNALTMAYGILLLQQGVKSEKRWWINGGLAMILILIVCRFFDTNWSFILRGLLFTLMGGLFFVANYWMLRKRRNGH